MNPTVVLCQAGGGAIEREHDQANDRGGEGQYQRPTLFCDVENNERKRRIGGEEGMFWEDLSPCPYKEKWISPPKGAKGKEG